MTETAQTLPIEIRDRWDGAVIHRSTTAKDLGAAMLEAIALKVDLRQANLERVALPYHSRLDGACLDGASLDGASLVGARLDGASLDGASLVGARLVGARLDGASLVGASLVGASLVGARLVGARLDGASLVGARLVGASLDGASLVGASLDGASLVGARLDGAGRIKAHALSRVAYAGPVGNASRTVLCFLAQANDDHKKPFLVFRCGCFIGDEKSYRAKVAELYGTQANHRRECLAALNACKALAALWPKPKAKK